MARALTDAFVQTVGSTPDAVDVILTDIEKSDWARGGELFSDKVLGG
jgi:4-oxalocrotonate tautomerase